MELLILGNEMTNFKQALDYIDTKVPKKFLFLISHFPYCFTTKKKFK